MSSDDNIIVIGKIGATYGIQGWLKIISFTEPQLGILEYSDWLLEDSKGWKRINVKAGKPHGKGLIAKLPGLENPEQARLLTGKKIAIKREQLPSLKKREYYWADLEGLTVVNENNAPLGKIIYLMETGSNDVLVVKGEKEHAIPFLLDEVVLSVDLTKKIMMVRWEII